MAPACREFIAFWTDRQGSNDDVVCDKLCNRSVYRRTEGSTRDKPAESVCLFFSIVN